MASSDSKNIPITPIIDERELWYLLLYKIAYPVVSNLANGTLKQNMPLEKSPFYDSRSESVSYLEAVGRTYAGIAPWLALPDEQTKESSFRKRLRIAAITGLNKCFDPESPDLLNFSSEYQPIVDSAYLVQAFLRAPSALWDPLDKITKQRIIASFKSLRNRKPFENNWLLFGSITEAFLLSIGEEYDTNRLKAGLRVFTEWYRGDGWYSDGPGFAFDYYNSFVIHPMLTDTLSILMNKGLIDKKIYSLALERMQRHAEALERLISPEGTFPPIGRSITYRTGVFHALSSIALMEKLPENLHPAQVRCALSKVKINMYHASDVFDRDNWLRLGFCGYDPNLADYYVSTGSLYMATLSFLPLGLPASNIFWSAPPQDWTAKKAWSGKPFQKDHRVNF